MYYIKIPGFGYFKFWGFSTGKKLETTQDLKEACSFTVFEEAKTACSMLANLLDRTDLDVVGMVL